MIALFCEKLRQKNQYRQSAFSCLFFLSCFLSAYLRTTAIPALSAIQTVCFHQPSADPALHKKIGAAYRLHPYLNMPQYPSARPYIAF